MQFCKTSNLDDHRLQTSNETKGREGNQDTSTRVSLGSYFFARDHKMCELPIIFSMLLNAAEYVVMAFNNARSGRAAVKWLKPVISS